MKTIFRTIIAALAATLTLVSCAKDELAGKDSTNPQSEGIRTIAVSFGVPTRSSLVGLQPSFDEDDEILVAQDDGMEEPEVCKVRNVGGKKVISTKLKGNLTLVYPKNAAQMDKSNENIIYGVYVSPSQSGRFEDANICMTKINSTATSAKFENKVAILKFYVDESIGVTKLKLSAEDSEFIASGSSTITVQAEDESLLKASASPIPTLANTTDDSQHRICYVAVLPITSKQLKVESWTTTQELSEANIVTRKYNDIKLAAGDIANVFVPYYIKVQVSSEPEAYQYWSYCNVGAFLPEEPGLYFAWGDTQGHRWDANSNQFEGGHSFTWANCPFNGGSEDFSSTAFEAAKATAFPSGTLVLAYDAANVNWGDKWRIPTSEEFGYVRDNAAHVDGGGISLGNHLFFPAAGSGDGAELTGFGQGSDYWSNTAYLSGGGDLAYALEFFSFYDEEEDELAQGICLGFPSRNTGFPIRPIYDETLSDGNDPVALTIASYPNGGTF